MLLAENRSMLALTLITSAILAGCNDTGSDAKQPTGSTPLVTPTAPSAPVSNDSNDSLNWTWSRGFEQASFYEIKVKSQQWQPVNGNPHQLALNQSYGVGELQVRVKADPASNRKAGLPLANTTAYSIGSVEKQPVAPTMAQENDIVDTFDWQFVNGFTQHAEYEYSVNGGNSWTTVGQKPLNVGNVDINTGDVQVRIKASPDNKLLSGLVLASTKAFTEALITPTAPKAPTNPQQNDTQNTFDWDYVTGHSQAVNYEYSLDRGVSWTTVTTKPVNVGDIDIAIGALQVRVKAAPATNTPAGATLVNTVAFTKSSSTPAPTTPAAPTNPSHDDKYDRFGWSTVSGHYWSADYEFSLDSGKNWTQVSQNPLSVGDINLPVGALQVRVRANPTDGVLAGAILSNTQAFTKAILAPTNPQQNDSLNTFNWDFVSGYSNLSDYEYSLDDGRNWQLVTLKPLQVGNVYLSTGHVEVRVKANPAAGLLAGLSIENSQPFTVYIAAPTNPLYDDTLNTFDWTFVSGFSSVSDYEYSVDAGKSWTGVRNKPLDVGNNDIAAGDLQVRVEGYYSHQRPDGEALVSTQAYTVTELPQPAAPTNLQQDDELNTFNWDLVPEFSQLDEYEFSLDGGATWSTVVAKPLNLGNVAIDVGKVLVRVKANVDIHQPAGLALANSAAYTVKLDIVVAAPTDAVVWNQKSTSWPYDDISANGFSWTLVNDTTNNVNYDKPEYYEFTNDGGSTWLPVVSIPVHVGAKAYAKDQVGVRVKENAITGSTNPAGEILFATAAVNDFKVVRIVAMAKWDTVATLTNQGDWPSSYDINCFVEYDATGAGQAHYWNKAVTTSDADTVTENLALEACGLSNWQLLDKTSLIAKTQADSSYIPSDFESELIIYSSTNSYWADDSGTFVKIKGGLEDTSSYSSGKAIAHWTLPNIDQIVTDSGLAKSELATLAGNYQSDWITTSSVFTALINKIVTTVNQTLAPQLADVNKADADAKVIATKIDNSILTYQAKVDVFSQYLTVLSKSDDVDAAKEQSFSDNLAAAKASLNELLALQTSYQSVAKVTPALTVFINATDKQQLAQTQEQAIDSAVSGSDVHANSLSLFEATSVLNEFVLSVAGITSDFEAGLADLPSANNSALIAAFNQLLTALKALPTSADIDSLNTSASNGLKRADSLGYQVLATNAIIGQHFAKLDMHGNYLPTATTYAQGWRCVLDNREPVRKRIWSLLKDGLPNGKDDLALDASATSITSVIGSNGLIENTNTQALCGRNDWALPTMGHMKSLETGTVGSKSTIDTAVFPHHLAMLAEYDKSTWGSDPGTLFYYWSRQESSSNYQKTYRYNSAENSSTETTHRKQGDEDAVVLARLMSEIKVTYQLLDKDGAITTDINAAACAFQPESKRTWQLFNTAELDQRAKKYDDVVAEVVTLNTDTLCGKSNWQVPQISDLSSLLPVDSSIFRNNDVLYGYSSTPICYVSSDAAPYSRQKCLNLTTEQVEDKDIDPYSINYTYRLMSAD